MKIFVIRRNYVQNNNLSSDSFSNKRPVFFVKPDSALLKDHKPFFLPDDLGQVVFGPELVVRISRLGKSIPVRFAHRYYDAVTVGVNFTAENLRMQLSRQGLPWDEATGFDGSAVIGDWVDKESLPDVQALHFCLKVNGDVVQRGCSGEMVHTIDELIAAVSVHFTLKTGDLLYTGCPSEERAVSINDEIEGFLEGQKVLAFPCK